MLGGTLFFSMQQISTFQWGQAQQGAPNMGEYVKLGTLHLLYKLTILVLAKQNK